MSNRTLAASEGGTTGFRRLKFENAIDPRRLRAILDGAGEEDSAFDLSSDQLIALEALNDNLGESIFLDDPAQCLPREEVRFILGFDREKPGARIRAVVSRAYWIADRYAEAYAQRLDDIGKLRRCAKGFEDAISALAGEDGYLFDKGKRSRWIYRESLAAEALAILRRVRLESADEAAGREEDIVQGLAAIDLIRENLLGLADHLELGGGRTEDEARFFFLLRLAEIFMIWSGNTPTFSYDKDKKYGRRGKAWHDFVTASFIVTGLAKADRDPTDRLAAHSVHNLLLRLGKRLGHEFSSPRDSRQINTLLDNLPSSGWLIDYKLAPEPAGYD